MNLRLGETEELLAYKAKKRPVVVVAARATLIGGLGKESGRQHHEEDRVVVAPVYDLATEDDPNGFGPILATRGSYDVYLAQ